MSDTLTLLRERKLVAIVRGIPQASMVELAQALFAGGISCIEVTYDQNSADPEETLGGISRIRDAMDADMLVGAGTVMSVGQVRQAERAGAKYIISPNVDPEVIAETKRLGLVSMPGAMTPTEVAAAFKAGADMVKLFPISSLGSAYVKAMRGPLSHIPLVAVGGVNPGNLGEFFDAGVAGAGIGGNLVSPKLVAEKDFDRITALAREYVDALQRATA